MSYILELQENKDGEIFVVFPYDMTEELNWNQGDILQWDLKGGGIILSKVNDNPGVEVLEE
jgi:bifunctional DNA-binding transcriptional regulator/antitoxin component of YhaV-PrlF toxin-antitoxin module|tara:strand:- start:825 stop:1007 length:183 start_codon:yes stop_codon:yes gene_type:complete